VGLWCGTNGGRWELSASALSDLAGYTLATTWLEPVLVTLSTSPDEVAAILDRSRICRVQLHGYQTPSFVRELCSKISCSVIKVLHMANGECVERSFLRHYERAGVSRFLIDGVAEDGQVGSNGSSLPPEAILNLLEAVNVTTMIAGGLTAENRSAFDRVVKHPMFCGSDFDTAARGFNGLDSSEIQRLVGAWAAPDHRTLVDQP